MTTKKTKKTTKAATAARTAPRRRAGTRGGKRRTAAIPVIDAARGFILEDDYRPDGSDPDDT